MARDHARIHSTVWSDPEFTSLSRAAQWLYFAILSQPTLSFCGATTFTAKRLARLADDVDEGDVLEAIAELEDARFILADFDTDELWVRSFVKNDGVLKSPNLLKRMAADFAAVMSERIKAAFAWEWNRHKAAVDPKHLEAIGDKLSMVPANPSTDPWETLPERVPLTRVAPAPTPSPSPAPEDTSEIDAQFGEFWDAYPRHRRTGDKGGGGSRHKALTMFKRLSADNRRRAIVAAGNYAAYIALPDSEFPCHATTWLNERRWEQWQEAKHVGVGLVARDAFAAMDPNDPANWRRGA